jgi:hypothetical protein
MVQSHTLRFAAATLSLFLLTGCDAVTSVFSKKDWREGVEEAGACIERVRAEYDKGVVKLLNSDEKRVPTYTFDITKMSFEDVKAITVYDQGVEKGSVQVSGFQAPPWKKRAFMGMNVDEKGAFFMGADPAYYRVRGEPLALAEVFAEGCKRQRPGMRLLSFTFHPIGAPETDGLMNKLEGENDK